MTSVAWVPPFFFNGATQATTLVVWVAPFFFLLFSLGLLFRSVFQHLYWGRSPAAACVTLCCREGLALFPPFFALRDSSSEPYFTTSGEQPCRRVCDTLPVAWVFPPPFCFKGGVQVPLQNFIWGSPGDRHVVLWCRRLGFPTPIFALRAFYYAAAFLRHFEKALE